LSNYSNNLSSQKIKLSAPIVIFDTDIPNSQNKHNKRNNKKLIFNTITACSFLYNIKNADKTFWQIDID